MKKIHFLHTLALMLTTGIIFSCSPGLFDDMNRVVNDPEIEQPVVTSFTSEQIIVVNWSDDEAADEYILYRADDQAVPSYSVIYSGKGTSYVDTGQPATNRKLYKLSKIRGSKEFGPSEYVLGVGCNTRRDEYEPNDTEGTATFLEYDISANLYYYRDTAGLSIEDADWYWVDVPPRRIANVVVTYASAAEQNSVYFSLKGSAPVTAVHNNAIAITNNTYTRKRFYFKIHPNSASFTGGPGAGGSIRNYTISLNSITSI